MGFANFIYFVVGTSKGLDPKIVSEISDLMDDFKPVHQMNGNFGEGDVSIGNLDEEIKAF